MEYDLTQGLRDLSRTPTVAPLPADPVVRRVRRGRAIRTTATGLAAAAVIIGAAAAVYAAPWNPPPPAETPSPAPTIEPSPDPTPEPTEEPTADDPPIVALTTAGDLLELDPRTGGILEVIASDETLRGPISLTPDRSAAYLGRGGPPYEVVRVSLTDGSITTVADGHTPSLSPDGRTLAYVAQYNINHPEDPEWRSLALLNLATGETQYLPDNTCGGCARRIDQPAWSPDGSRLYVSAGFEDGPAPTLAVLEVVPGETSALDDARVIIPEAVDLEDLGHPQFLADGRLAFVGVTDLRPRSEAGSGPPHDAIWGIIALVDPATSRIVELHQFPELHSVDVEGFHITRTTDAAASPTEPTLAIVTQASGLYLWAGGDQLLLLTEGIVAVAW